MKSVILIYLLFFNLSSMLFAQDISGRVIDSETGLAIEGANILLKGTLLGASSGRDGAFKITGVTYGSYSVLVTIIGYSTVVQKNIIVPSITASKLMFSLKSVPLSGEGIIVTANRRPEQLSGIPASIEVISEESITSKDYETIDEAISYVPSVNFVESQVNIRGSSGYMRGVGTRVLFMLDGVPLTAGESGDVKWNALPMFAVEKIEIMKGSGSALYGSSAMGGVINVITKKPSADPVTQARVSLGYFDDPAYSEFRWTDKKKFTRSISLSHGRKFGNTGLLFSVNGFSSDGYRRNGESDRYSIFVKVDHDLTETSSLTLFSNFASDEHGIFSAWVSPNRPFETPENTWNDFTISTKMNAHAVYRKLISPTRSIVARINYYRTHFDNQTSAGDDRSTAHKPGADAQLNQIIGRHFLVLGSELWYTSVNADIFGIHDVSDGALYFQDKIELNSNSNVVLGMRLDRHSKDGDLTSIQFNPKAAVLWSLNDNSSIHFTLGRGFRAPSVAETFIQTRISIFLIGPNPDLKPESSWSYEFGWRSRLPIRSRLNIAFFRSDFTDLIEPSLGSDGIIRFRNVSAAFTQGMEFSIASNPFGKFEIVTLYTYTDSEDKVLKLPLTYRHKNIFSIYPSLRLFAVKFTLEYRYKSRIDRVAIFEENPITGQDKRIPIKLFDARIEVPVSVGHIRFTATNLTNYHYTEIERSMRPGRSFVISLGTVF